MVEAKIVGCARKVRLGLMETGERDRDRYGIQIERASDRYGERWEIRGRRCAHMHMSTYLQCVAHAHTTKICIYFG